MKKQKVTAAIEMCDQCAGKPYIFVWVGDSKMKIRASYLAYYEAQNAVGDKQPRQVEYHETKSGELIIDSIKQI